MIPEMRLIMIKCLLQGQTQGKREEVPEPVFSSYSPCSSWFTPLKMLLTCHQEDMCFVRCFRNGDGSVWTIRMTNSKPLCVLARNEVSCQSVDVKQARTCPQRDLAHISFFLVPSALGHSLPTTTTKCHVEPFIHAISFHPHNILRRQIIPHFTDQETEV